MLTDPFMALVVVHLVLALVVVVDAYRQQSDPKTWGLAVFFLGIIGVVAYLVAGRNR
jgi:hypothetical protein